MKILLFGATGAAGGSVLQMCLADSGITELRAIARRPPAVPTTNKLRVTIHADFADYSAIGEAFQGVDACLYCLGISTTQAKSEAHYREITFEYALAAAKLLKEQSPGAAFHYVSGQGARLDSRMMWARVKAEAEQALMTAIDAVCWRPAYIDGAPSESQARSLRLLRPLFRLLRSARGMYVSGDDIGRAMLEATRLGYRHRIIENREIRDLAEAYVEHAWFSSGSFIG